VPVWLSSLRDLIVEASPMRRFMFALLFIVPIVALAAAYWWFNPPAYRVLYTQLSDRSGGEVIAALEQLDIPYQLSATDGSIEVPAKQLHVARYRLAVRGLPKSDEDAEDEVDRAPRFGASSLQEQQRFQRTLEIDLARSIQKLDAVELARVHLALPKVSPFLRDAPSATAAVLVRLRAGTTLTQDQVTTIQTLVAAGVPRLKRAEVQVLDPRGVLLGEPAPAAAQSQRLALEQDLVQRARAVLVPWLGKDRVSVQVTATLDASETRQTVERVIHSGGAGNRPQEKSVQTTRVPEGQVQRINVVVILGFDATPDDRQRAGQLVQQTLGLDAVRGDRVNVYVLPAVVQPQPEKSQIEKQGAPEVTASKPAVPASNSLPRIEVQPRPAQKPDALSGLVIWWPAVAGLLVLAGGWLWLRVRPSPTPEIETDVSDFDSELELARNQVLADPRVTADVIRLWMRA